MNRIKCVSWSYFAPSTIRVSTKRDWVVGIAERCGERLKRAVTLNGQLISLGFIRVFTLSVVSKTFLGFRSGLFSVCFFFVLFPEDFFYWFLFDKFCRKSISSTENSDRFKKRIHNFLFFYEYLILFTNKMGRFSIDFSKIWFLNKWVF